LLQDGQRISRAKRKHEIGFRLSTDRLFKRLEVFSDFLRKWRAKNSFLVTARNGQLLLNCLCNFAPAKPTRFFCFLARLIYGPFALERRFKVLCASMCVCIGLLINLCTSFTRIVHCAMFGKTAPHEQINVKLSAENQNESKQSLLLRERTRIHFFPVAHTSRY